MFQLSTDLSFHYSYPFLLLCSVFKELLSRIVHEKKNGGPHIPKIQEKKGNRFSIADLPGDMEFATDHKSTRKMKANTVSGGRNKIRKMLEKTRFSILPPKPFRWVGFVQSVILVTVQVENKQLPVSALSLTHREEMMFVWGSMLLSHTRRTAYRDTTTRAVYSMFISSKKINL